MGLAWSLDWSGKDTLYIHWLVWEEQLHGTFVCTYGMEGALDTLGASLIGRLIRDTRRSIQSSSIYVLIRSQKYYLGSGKMDVEAKVEVKVGS
jgi:hypothetical protein